MRILYAILSPSIILQVGVAMESYSRFLDAFQGIFIATMTFLVVLAAGVGWFMARRAVSGVEAVTRTAQKISGGALEERVPVKSGAMRSISLPLLSIRCWIASRRCLKRSKK